MSQHSSTWEVTAARLSHTSPEEALGAGNGPCPSCLSGLELQSFLTSPPTHSRLCREPSAWRMCLYTGILPALQAHPAVMPTCQALAGLCFPCSHHGTGRVSHEISPWTLTTVDLER